MLCNHLGDNWIDGDLDHDVTDVELDCNRCGSEVVDVGLDVERRCFATGGSASASTVAASVSTLDVSLTWTTEASTGVLLLTTLSDVDNGCINMDLGAVDKRRYNGDSSGLAIDGEVLNIDNYLDDDCLQSLDVKWRLRIDFDGLLVDDKEAGRLLYVAVLNVLLFD
ncbi:hypothetical protein NDU88_009623 [Pleurodeles waltl]|uniref:Uncharacterized protein n=1 Tax=Pleurodeles waltl TaxID=8319 RepID=A0AAV7QXU9_PLEWA|nr:hypothetical protein NDU88_009623 [Pleurodeles waltl]